MSIRVTSAGALRTILIDRPEAANALTPAMLADVCDALQQAGASGSTRVVILRGEGGRAFSAGYDVQSIPTGSEPFEPEAAMDRVVDAIEACPRPVVAMIEGHCMGFACDLAMACDLRLATTSARFAIPAARLGGVYPPRGIQRLMNTMGRAGTQELLLTTQGIDARRAVELGLVHRVFAPESIADETGKLASLLAESAPLALAATKAVIRKLCASAGPHALSELQPMIDAVRSSRDAAEGKRAFLEKRRPAFSGE